MLRYRRHIKLLERTLAVDDIWVTLYFHPKVSDEIFGATGTGSPNVPRPVLRERKRMLIMAMDFNDIAFWRLCEEKDNGN